MARAFCACDLPEGFIKRCRIGKSTCGSRENSEIAMIRPHYYGETPTDKWIALH
jgi:hypothetical protein